MLAGGHNGGVCSEKKKASGSSLGLLGLIFSALHQPNECCDVCRALEKVPEGEVL